MFVSQMSVEERTGGKLLIHRTANPTLEQIELAIDSLNAETVTIVTLEGKVGAQLVIGGGDGNYIVYATYRENEFFNVLAPSHLDDPDTTLELEIGGQIGDYPLRQCADLASALQAARRFAADGARDDSLMWEKE